LQLGCDYIGTEHILLGVIHNDTSVAARTLAGLGAQPDAVRLRVIEMLPRRSASRLGARTGTQMRLGPDSETARLDALAVRVAAVERWTGMKPDLTELDQVIAGLRRDKEAAIDAKNFKRAEDPTATETELLIDRDATAREWTERSPLAAEVAELRAEVTRLRTVLRERGIDPGQA